MNKIPMTAEGFNRLREELKRLKTVDRPAIDPRHRRDARDHGDLAENAEYHAARDRQSFIEGRVIELEDKVARAEVIDVSKLSGSSIKFGATVTLADEETDEEQTFQIVGEDEADDQIRPTRLSVTSPFGHRALIGKGEGDSVEVANLARREILRGRHRRLRLRRSSNQRRLLIFLLRVRLLGNRDARLVLRHSEASMRET